MLYLMKEVYRAEALFRSADLLCDDEDNVPEDERRYSVVFEENVDGDITLTMFAYDLGHALKKGGRVIVVMYAGVETEDDSIPLIEEEDDAEKEDHDGV